MCSSDLFLIITASMYSRMLGVAALPTLFGEWMQGLEMGFVAVMVLYVIMLIFLGTILDTTSIILIIVPLFLPMAEELGMHLVWFGIIIVVVLEMGMISPPVGINVFVVKSIAPDVSMGTIFRGIWPFWFAMAFLLILLVMFPQIALFLPQTLVGG